MKTVAAIVLGLVLGFFVGEALAAFIGIATGQVFDGTSAGPALWVLRSLPFVLAVAGAIAASFVVNRRGSR